MSEEARAIPVNPPEQKISAGAGPALAAPNFDARSIRRARPAVPLTRADGRPSTLTWALVALVAGMCGGLLGILVLNSYQTKDAARQAEATAPAAAGQNVNAAPPAGVGDERVASSPPQAAADNTNAATQPSEAEARGTDGEESAQLRGALQGWLAATNARDLERQMDFYDSRVSVFYLSRNASRAAVRAEKAQVFSGASSVDVRAGEPQISISPDGRTATMRFRKQFAIEGAGLERRGAVLQELRWRRTPQGWKITGERDLSVVN